MRKILAFTLLIMLLAGSAWAQPTPLATPPSPESQGIQIPQATSGSQAPPSSEGGQALMATTGASARAAAPSFGARVGSGSYAGSYASTYGTDVAYSTYMIVPPGVSAANKFYIPYSPSTVAGCNFGQWLPMWLDVSGTGPLYMYEWYPSGRLESKYLAYIRYPGWKKMWFNGDAAGWHILQYHCNGWSNYIYVYVYESSYYPPYSPGYNPPSPSPSYPPSPGPGCNAQIVVQSNHLRGYSVSVDGNYIGGDGRRGDHFDGTFAFTVTGNQPHNIKINKDSFSYTQTNTYNCGRSYTIYV